MSQNNDNQPLAQAFTIADLPGRVRKYLDVPQGRRGVTVDGDGEVETFEPGRHLVLSGIGRLLGGGGGFRAGYVPAGPFTARIKAENLLSDDDVLIDASLLAEVEVMDPGRFFTQWVIPRGLIHGTSLDLSSEAAWQVLGSQTRNHTAADLISGAANERILAHIRAGLESCFNGQGLYLDFINFVSFWRADDRALAAEKAQVLRDRLREVELEEKMAEVETEIQFQDFVNQLEPELVDKVGLHPVVDSSKAKEAGQEGGSILDTFRSWINFESEKGENGRHFRLDGLFRRAGKKDEEEARRGRKRPKWWWLPRAAWMAFVFLIAFLLTKMVNWIAGDAGWVDRWQFHLAVWGFAVVAILESLKTLIQKREQLERVRWPEPGSTFVDDLVGKDRLQADALVRRQCQQDLSTAEKTLNDLRSRVYKEGDEDAALKIRALEKKVARVGEQVMNPNTGVPPYVTDLKVSRKLWDDYLDYDEKLLVRVSALNQDVQQFQQDYTRGSTSLHRLDQLEGRLDAFRYHFENRSQALRSSEEQKDHYRIQN